MNYANDLILTRCGDPPRVRRAEENGVTGLWRSDIEKRQCVRGRGSVSSVKALLPISCGEEPSIRLVRPGSRRFNEWGQDPLYGDTTLQEMTVPGGARRYQLTGAASHSPATNATGLSQQFSPPLPSNYSRQFATVAQDGSQWRSPRQSRSPSPSFLHPQPYTLSEMDPQRCEMNNSSVMSTGSNCDLFDGLRAPQQPVNFRRNVNFSFDSVAPSSHTVGSDHMLHGVHTPPRHAPGYPGSEAFRTSGNTGSSRGLAPYGGTLPYSADSAASVQERVTISIPVGCHGTSDGSGPTTASVGQGNPVDWGSRSRASTISHLTC
ncbi:hypothetical protein ERJ75_000107700 [Trypanosoma vivax]|nr:hypothetical protein ERJ75_000107700 [Trypanosoma vivax]